MSEVTLVQFLDTLHEELSPSERISNLRGYNRAVSVFISAIRKNIPLSDVDITEETPLNTTQTKYALQSIKQLVPTIQAIIKKKSIHSKKQTDENSKRIDKIALGLLETIISTREGIGKLSSKLEMLMRNE